MVFPSALVVWTQFHSFLRVSIQNEINTIRRKLFDDWFTLIQDPETFKLEYYQNYVGNLTVQTYDESGKTNYKVQYYNVYPLLVTAQQLSWTETNVLRLTTEFAYEKWKQIPLDTEIKTRNKKNKELDKEYNKYNNYNDFNRMG